MLLGFKDKGFNASGALSSDDILMQSQRDDHNIFAKFRCWHICLHKRLTTKEKLVAESL